MTPWCDEPEVDFLRCIYLFGEMDPFACNPWPVGNKRRIARGKLFAQHAIRYPGCFLLAIIWPISRALLKWVNGSWAVRHGGALMTGIKPFFRGLIRLLNIR